MQTRKGDLKTWKANPALCIKRENQNFQQTLEIFCDDLLTLFISQVLNVINKVLGPDVKLLQSMALLKPPGEEIAFMVLIRGLSSEG